MIKIRIKNLKKFVPWHKQEFGDARGTWLVGDLHKYIKENELEPQSFSVKELAKNNLDPEEETETSDKSKENFQTRAHSSDLKFPIVVVEYPDGLWIADGVHRTWKAKNNKQKEIMGYLLDWEDDLLNIKHSEPSEESKDSPY
jgi:hypothetical protein